MLASRVRPFLYLTLTDHHVITLLLALFVMHHRQYKWLFKRLWYQLCNIIRLGQPLFTPALFTLTLIDPLPLYLLNAQPNGDAQRLAVSRPCFDCIKRENNE